MRPYILQGHERPLNQVKFNYEGDLFITCAKDGRVNLWWTENGQRAGTFNGHNGVVWTTDITSDSSKVFTAGGDSSVRLWNFETGEELFKLATHAPCRACAFSPGDGLAAFSSDAFLGSECSVRVLKIAPDGEEQTEDVVQTLSGISASRISRVLWSDGDRTLITASDDGELRRWDVESGKCVLSKKLHKAQIQDLQASADGSHLITASTDQTSKLVDTATLQVLKEYTSTVPINSAAISPRFDHVLIGGGQDASKVTTTSAKVGRFEARFFHKIYAEEFGQVKGHFGPINAVAFSPDGTSFVSGGEEGYVRLHHFDADYFTTKFF